MKKVFLILVMFAVFTINAQTTTTQIISSEKCSYHEMKFIKVYRSDSTFYYYYSFNYQNMRYSHISDFESIGFSQIRIKEFRDALKRFLNKQQKNGVREIRQIYLSKFVYDNSKYCTIYSDNNKYTRINKRQAKKLIEFIDKYILFV